MNNRNWIAVFLGLASLVLLVSVMGASNNWMNDGTNNNGSTVPQQINQTVRGMDSANKDNLPTKINGDEMLDNMSNEMTNDMNTTSPMPSTTPSPSPTVPLITQ